jgi:hypothetical protein
VSFSFTLAASEGVACHSRAAKAPAAAMLASNVSEADRHPGGGFAEEGAMATSTSIFALGHAANDPTDEVRAGSGLLGLGAGELPAGRRRDPRHGGHLARGIRGLCQGSRPPAASGGSGRAPATVLANKLQQIVTKN